MTAAEAGRRTGGASGAVELGSWGMLLFIAAESVLFSLLFATYFYIRSDATAWPPPGVAAPGLVMPFLNTVILLSSSATMALAERGVRRGSQNALKSWLLATFVLGWAFLAIQLSEYAREDMSIGDSAYASLFYVITAFHGTHVFAGLLMNGFVQARAWRGHFSPTRHLAVRNAGRYWHFVDAVWVFVLFTVYLSPHLMGAPR